MNDGRHIGKDITTEVRNRDTVQWAIPNSGITSLDGINDTSTDVFNPDPAQQCDGSWRGTIKSTISHQKTYLVEYTLNGKKYNHDPKNKDQSINKWKSLISLMFLLSLLLLPVVRGAEWKEADIVFRIIKL